MKRDINLELAKYLDAALALHGLVLNEARRAEVEKQFLLLSNMNSIVESEPISNEIESSNIFRL